MTNQPDDLVEELLALYQNMQFGHIPAFKIMESVARAAATIKELKAEVERWKEAHSTVEAELTANERQVDVLQKALHDTVSTNAENCRQRDAAEARAARVEEALVDLAELSGEFGISLPMRVRNALAAIPKITGKALGEGKA